MHFPKEVPFEDIKVVIGYLRRDGTTINQAIDSGIWVLGCGAQFIPDAGPAPMGTVPEASDEDKATALESAITVRGDSKAFPWASVLSIVGPMILDFIKRRWQQPQ